MNLTFDDVSYATDGAHLDPLVPEALYQMDVLPGDAACARIRFDSMKKPKHLLVFIQKLTYHPGHIFQC